MLYLKTPVGFVTRKDKSLLWWL